MNLDSKKSLKENLIYFNPVICYAGTAGGVRLCFYPDCIDSRIIWVVYEGDHITEFPDSDSAIDYYCKATGIE